MSLSGEEVNDVRVRCWGLKVGGQKGAGVRGRWPGVRDRGVQQGGAIFYPAIVRKSSPSQSFLLRPPNFSQQFLNTNLPLPNASWQLGCVPFLTPDRDHLNAQACQLLCARQKNMEKFGRISFRHFLSTPIHTRPIPLPCHHFRTALCDPGCVSWQPACGCRGPCSPCVGRSAPRGGGELWPNNWLSLTTHSFLRQEVSS